MTGGGAASFSGGFILVSQLDLQVHNAVNGDFLMLPVSCGTLWQLLR